MRRLTLTVHPARMKFKLLYVVASSATAPADCGVVFDMRMTLMVRWIISTIIDSHYFHRLQ